MAKGNRILDYAVASGKMLKDSGEIVNIADILEGLKQNSDVARTDTAVLVVKAIGAGPLAVTVSPKKIWEIHGILLNVSAVGGSGTLTMRVDAGAGVEYDKLIYSRAMAIVQDLVYLFEKPIPLEAFDEVDIAWANAGNLDFGLSVLYSLR